MKQTALGTLALGLSLAAGASLATPARADAPSMQVSVEPWSAYDGVDRPYRYIVTWRAVGNDPVEVALDRRLLSFEVRATAGRRARRHRCRHPRAPRSSARARTRVIESGEREWREWIDLRMYCWGRALSALESGAEVQGRYGWRRASRRRWVARPPETRRPRGWLGGVPLEPFTVLARETEANETRRIVEEDSDGDETGHDAGDSSPIVLGLRAGSASRGSGLRFRVSVGAASGTERVYVRPDAFSFVVRGPGGEVACRLSGGGGYPPPDLFRRVSARRRAVELLDASQFCPDDTFEHAGIYEVVPKLELEHSGEEWNLRAITGRFAGPPAAMRILSGEVGYVEQTPRRADEEASGEGDDDG